MQYNKYKMYSIISSAENQKLQDFSKVLSLLEHLEQIKIYSKAKEYIKNSYGINDVVRNFQLSSEAHLCINENKERYSIRVIYKNNEESECIIYSYKK